MEHKVNYPNATIKKTLIWSDLGGGEVILNNNSFCRKIPKEDPSDLLLNTLNFIFIFNFLSLWIHHFAYSYIEIWQKTLPLSYSLFFTLHRSPWQICQIWYQTYHCLYRHHTCNTPRPLPHITQYKNSPV